MSAIDALVSPTLKHLRERWWDDDFTEFLVETLKPRPGNRILDVGCGEGLAEICIGRQHISQVRLFGIDLIPAKVAAARDAVAAHNQRAAFAAADACRLPFGAAAFDSIVCVAVLQHIGDISAAVGELARVTTGGGRVVAVEPDNSARYFYSSALSGTAAFAAAGRFFAAAAQARGDSTDPAVGPKLPLLFDHHGIEPLAVRLFPVAHAQLGAPAREDWAARRQAAERALAAAANPAVRAHGEEYLKTLGAYEAEAVAAGNSFVEIQHTMLFGVVGQRRA
jgi:SAM-dependent methyltransferase